ncbi:MAG TPA: hypothetical protein VGE74_16250 [Gemmata sp.]
MLTRSLFALGAVLGFALAGRAVDLPAGTWAANVDGEKGEFVVKEIKDGKVTGSLLGADFTGTWDGKALAFQRDRDLYEAHLVSEPSEKGKTKYTLTGTRARPLAFPNRAGTVHYAKTGWYAQLAADTTAPAGFIKAEVRGVLVSGRPTVAPHILVKRLAGTATVETRVQLAPSDGKAVNEKLKALDGKEVIVTGELSEIPPGRAGGGPRGLVLSGKLEIRLVTDPK